MYRAKQPVEYVAKSGKRFVYLSSMPIQSDLLYSPDGETYFRLVCRGFGGSSIDHDLSFEDPHRGVSGTLRHEENVVLYDGELYFRQEAPLSLENLKIIPLPAARYTEYLMRTADGTFIYVGADKYEFSYESFRMYIGDGTTMREVPISRVERFRDGGTTIILTAEGRFYSPSPFYAQEDPERQFPKWGEEPLVRLKADDYDIVETPEGRVTITKK